MAKVVNNNMRFDDPELVESAIHLGRLMLKQKKLEKGDGNNGLYRTSSSRN